MDFYSFLIHIYYLFRYVLDIGNRLQDVGAEEPFFKHDGPNLRTPKALHLRVTTARAKLGNIEGPFACAGRNGRLSPRTGSLVTYIYIYMYMHNIINI